MEKLIKYVLSAGYKTYNDIETISTMEDFLNAFMPKEAALVLETTEDYDISLLGILYIAKEVHKEKTTEARI